MLAWSWAALASASLSALASIRGRRVLLMAKATRDKEEKKGKKRNLKKCISFSGSMVDGAGGGEGEDGVGILTRLGCEGFGSEYAKLPLIPPYKQPGNHHFINGVNFASAGAGVLVETNQGLVIDLKTQLSYFKHVERLLREQLGDKEANKLLSRAVYLFCIGGNDYATPLVMNSTVFQSYSQQEYVEMVIGNFTAVIKEIYKEGGRKFGFFSLSPFGCLPVMRALNPGNSSGCLEELNDLVKLHNYAVSQVLQKLEKQLKGFIYSNFDSYTSSSERTDNPSRYGFKEGKSACCGWGPYRGINSCGGKRGMKEYLLCHNPSEFVFFDSNHPSEMFNQQLAKLMWSGTPNTTWPYNLKALFEV
ncbi:hypothetical protein F0562_002970 [Nyssa sinensis]|uniref:SGNH hydrolase-type esterase domain-containing protein n=1 Tax=Nyssa sinensis TaxID=561372 RepID=A0A5J5BYF1_9ASTE|nr:hypothetical protein F0562_002970 [Nyssa sinensis]